MKLGPLQHCQCQCNAQGTADVPRRVIGQGITKEIEPGCSDKADQGGDAVGVVVKCMVARSFDNPNDEIDTEVN